MVDPVYNKKLNSLPCCNFPHPLVKHMSSVESKLRKFLEVGKQAGWTSILNFKGLPSFRITKSFSNVLLMNFIPTSTFQTICTMSLVCENFFSLGLLGWSNLVSNILIFERHYGSANYSTVKSWFKKVHFFSLKSRLVWFKKDLCSKSKNRLPPKKALCT